MDFSVWLAFAAASLALLLIPGPTVLLVLSYAVSQGRRVALATVAGVALGDTIAMSLSLLGLGALLATSATLFTVLKWAGAAYLVWLGVGLFRSAGKAEDTTVEDQKQVSPAHVFRHATIVTALNPKGIVFFVSFVPQFIAVDAALAPQFAILIATFVGLATLNALAYALLGARIGTRMTGANVQRQLGRIGGSALVTMGLATASLSRSTN